MCATDIKKNPKESKCSKKSKSDIRLQNGGQNTNLKFEMGKTTFLKKFFHKIWLIIGDCKYNYNGEIKIAKSYSLALFWENKY